MRHRAAARPTATRPAWCGSTGWCSAGSVACWGCGVVPWVLSARGEAALRAQAGRLGELVAARPELGSADVGALAGAARARLRIARWCWVASASELLGGVGRAWRGEDGAGVHRGVLLVAGRLAFLFTGQGAQRVGYGPRAVRGVPGVPGGVRRGVRGAGWAGRAAAASVEGRCARVCCSRARVR